MYPFKVSLKLIQSFSIIKNLFFKFFKLSSLFCFFSYEVKRGRTIAKNSLWTVLLKKHKITRTFLRLNIFSCMLYDDKIVIKISFFNCSVSFFRKQKIKFMKYNVIWYFLKFFIFVLFRNTKSLSMRFEQFLLKFCNE